MTILKSSALQMNKVEIPSDTVKLLKKVLKAAAKVPGGFEVDMTVTE